MKSKRIKISDNSVRRLSKYIRKLKELESSEVEAISSMELGDMLGLTSSQIRQDLSAFGDFGLPGYGYGVPSLRRGLEDVLGVNSKLTAILVGVGNIGKALIENFPFSKCGVQLLGAFDIDPGIVGERVGEIMVQNRIALDEQLTREAPDITILCVTRDAANDTANYLVERGVTAIWNFTNTEILSPYSPVLVENVHFSDSLQTLCYYINEKNKKRPN